MAESTYLKMFTVWFKKIKKKGMGKGRKSVEQWFPTFFLLRSGRSGTGCVEWAASLPGLPCCPALTPEVQL